MDIPNHLQKTAFFQLLLQAAVAFFIINCSIPPVHAAIDKDCDSGIIISVQPPLKPNGKFKVYVEKEIMSLKVWQKVGIVE